MPSPNLRIINIEPSHNRTNPLLCQVPTCRCEFTNSSGLSRHMRKGKHDFHPQTPEEAFSAPFVHRTPFTDRIPPVKEPPTTSIHSTNNIRLLWPLFSDLESSDTEEDYRMHDNTSLFAASTLLRDATFSHLSPSSLLSSSLSSSPSLSSSSLSSTSPSPHSTTTHQASQDNDYPMGSGDIKSPHFSSHTLSPICDGIPDSAGVNISRLPSPTPLCDTPTLNIGPETPYQRHKFVEEDDFDEDGVPVTRVYHPYLDGE